VNQNIKRRILGTEKVILVDGTEKEINIFAVTLSEKNQLSRIHRKRVVIGTGNNKTADVEIHDDEIIKGMLDIAFQGQILYEELDSTEGDLYNKYFNKQAYTSKESKEGENSKNSNTSEQSEAKEDQ